LDKANVLFDLEILFFSFFLPLREPSKRHSTRTEERKKQKIERSKSQQAKGGKVLFVFVITVTWFAIKTKRKKIARGRNFPFKNFHYRAGFFLQFPALRAHILLISVFNGFFELQIDTPWMRTK
jgi:hypothetical protein